MHVCNPSRLSNQIFRFLGSMCTGPSTPEVKLWLETVDTRKSLPICVLIDSGASGTFISQQFVIEHELMTHRLEEPIPVRNADGSISRGGSIEEFCDIIISTPPSFRERLNLEVVALGQFDVILGFPWLQRHNPKVDWKDRTLELLPDTTLFMHTAAGVPESGEDTVWTEDPYADLLASIGLDSVPKAFDFL
jgi:Retroviral aspartyl protease